MEIVTNEVSTKTKWSIDTSHSEIGFKVKHLMIANVRGRFTEFDASIYTTTENFSSVEIDCWINPASIDTNDKKRDEHVKSADFFDVENFKEINFTGDTYNRIDDDESYELWGELTIKGVAKKIKLIVEFGGMIQDPWGNLKAIFTITGKINRKDFGLNWNSDLKAGGILVSNEVWINCEVQLMKVK